MGNYAAVYQDDTHTYQLVGPQIVMRPLLPGAECALILGKAEEAREYLAWIVRSAHLRKYVPSDAATSRGTGKQAKGSIPQRGKKRK